jgi:hypothetical protein
VGEASKCIITSALVSYVRWVSLCGLSVSTFSGIFGRSQRIMCGYRKVVTFSVAALTARHMACIWLALVVCPLQIRASVW